MHNKLIILTFALFASFAGLSQTQDGQVVSAERNIMAGSINMNNTIELYPNPTVDYLIVNIKNSTLQNAKIEIHSLIGTEIFVNPEDLGNGKFKIPVKDFASGYYLVVVKDDQARYKVARKFLTK
jgi:predicted amidohydrolase